MREYYANPEIPPAVIYAMYSPRVSRCYILHGARTAAGFHLRLHGRNHIALCREQTIVAAAIKKAETSADATTIRHPYHVRVPPPPMFIPMTIVTQQQSGCANQSLALWLCAVVVMIPMPNAKC